MRGRNTFSIFRRFRPLSVLLRTRRPYFAPLLLLKPCALLHPAQPRRPAPPTPPPAAVAIARTSSPLDEKHALENNRTLPQAPRHSLFLREPARPKPLQRRRLQREEEEEQQRRQGRQREVALHTPAEQIT